MSDAANLEEPTRTCPACNTQHPLTVDLCQCGYLFPGSGSPGHPTLGAMGYALISLGLILSAWAVFALKTAVGDYAPVHNIGLMQQQMIIFQAGMALALMGSVFTAADKVREAIAAAAAGGGDRPASH